MLICCKAKKRPRTSTDSEREITTDQNQGPESGNPSTRSPALPEDPVPQAGPSDVGPMAVTNIGSLKPPQKKVRVEDSPTSSAQTILPEEAEPPLSPSSSSKPLLRLKSTSGTVMASGSTSGYSDAHLERSDTSQGNGSTSDNAQLTGSSVDAHPGNVMLAEQPVAVTSLETATSMSSEGLRHHTPQVEAAPGPSIRVRHHLCLL